MSPRAMRARNAFSLLEIIIATAILAGSAMVLFSLIGLGTKYGNRAEEQTLALSQAQSVLDEYVARISSGELQEGMTQDGVSGVLNGVPARSYRIEILPFDLAGNSGASRNTSESIETQSVLVKVTVSIYNGNGSLAGMESEPICQLTCLVRRPRNDVTSPGGTPNMGGTPRAVASSVTTFQNTLDSKSKWICAISVRFRPSPRLGARGRALAC